MLLRLLPLLALTLLPGCGGAAEEVLPVSAEIRGAAAIERVAVRMRTNRVPPDAATLIESSIAAAGQRWGLTSGRALSLIVEVDQYTIAGAGEALFGGEDRLAGSVFIRDASTNKSLGQLYIDLNRSTPGLLGLLTRGGSVRERLAEAFAERVARAISGRDAPPR